MWQMKPEAEYAKRARSWPKKYRRELAAMHDNLSEYMAALNTGTKVEQIKFGFMHFEPHGVVAIDQKGGGAGLTQTRLYTFLDHSQKVVHLITVGDKSTQKADIQYCSEFVAEILKPKQN